MITEYRKLKLISFYLFVFSVFVTTVLGQKTNLDSINYSNKGNYIKQDTALELRNRYILSVQQPDTNFTYEKYAAFLTKISDTSKYVVLPLNEFRTIINNKKIVIGLRHDVDNDLNLALRFSESESRLGFRSTYFILHTAPYYLVNPDIKTVHTDSIIPVLKFMQDEKHFEIGFHNDLVTLQAVYNIDPVNFLHKELSWLRSNGINIYGTASHGSNYCYIYYYLNYYFFVECTYPVVGQFVNNLTLPIGGAMIPMKKGTFSDFDLRYEAYFLNNNKAFSDATIINGIRWDIGMLDLDDLHPGDRVIILTHPIHWHKASTIANFESFRISGQKSSSINESRSAISVEMPYGTNLNSLVATYSLSPGAYAKVSNKQQVNGSTLNNFSEPVVYEVYAENRDIKREWTVNVSLTKNSDSDFESFEVPGVTKTVNINKTKKTIFVELAEGTDLTRLSVRFELSQGASAWIGEEEQYSNTGFVDFSHSVEYTVVAEDGFSSSTWIVSILCKIMDVDGPSTADTRPYGIS